jgi:hypothetical protein
VLDDDVLVNSLATEVAEMGCGARFGMLTGAIFAGKLGAAGGSEASWANW